MKNISRLMTAFLAMVLLFSAAGGILTGKALETQAWEENILVADPIGTFGVELELIEIVSFQDNLEDVPEIAWNMGVGATDKVKAWFTWEDGGHVHFAAEGGINGKDCTKAMFKDLKNLREVNFNGAFHTEQAESMKEMFYGCKKLEKLDVSTLNTGNVKSFYGMFQNCRKLTELDLTTFDTANATNMSRMFSSCGKLETLKVDGWNTENVINVEAMFMNCWNLKDLDLTGWNVDSVKYRGGFLDRDKTINGEAWKKFFD